ncbi:Bro-N domain-containing protein [Sedimenticola hydrogenitrophicus]|uniref:BRO-N domain-containing protein n=1 Tax=Sedimenticola hydrogenitrophicus TaxID=2967975 RepID=UPI0023B07E40|nr:BRO family protein [Sedimenticola hydrogenitrophicus]
MNNNTPHQNFRNSTNIQVLPNPFDFETHNVRIAIGRDGEPWFCAKDVFETLGIAWKGVSGSLKNTPEEWQGVCYLQTPGGTQEAVFLSEPAVYQTAFISRKPESIAFTKWVCEEILPAIRKQGYYGALPAGNQVQLTTVMIKLLDPERTSAHSMALFLCPPVLWRVAWGHPRVRRSPGGSSNPVRPATLSRLEPDGGSSSTYPENCHD